MIRLTLAIIVLALGSLLAAGTLAKTPERPSTRGGHAAPQPDHGIGGGVLSRVAVTYPTVVTG